MQVSDGPSTHDVHGILGIACQLGEYCLDVGTQSRRPLSPRCLEIIIAKGALEVEEQKALGRSIEGGRREGSIEGWRKSIVL